MIRRGFGSVLMTEVTPDTMGVLRDGRRIAVIGFALTAFNFVSIKEKEFEEEEKEKHGGEEGERRAEDLEK